MEFVTIGLSSLSLHDISKLMVGNTVQEQQEQTNNIPSHLNKNGSRL